MRILRKPELEAKVGFCERAIREMEAAGQFPKRIPINPLGGRAIGWAEHEVDAWIQARMEAREAA
jgi:prophage regulatory protein